jgi:hypothetical protein
MTLLFTVISIAAGASHAPAVDRYDSSRGAVAVARKASHDPVHFRACSFEFEIAERHLQGEEIAAVAAFRMAKPLSRLEFDCEGIAFAVMDGTRSTELAAYFPQVWYAGFKVATDFAGRQQQVVHGSISHHRRVGNREGFNWRPSGTVCFSMKA